MSLPTAFPTPPTICSTRHTGLIESQPEHPDTSAHLLDHIVVRRGDPVSAPRRSPELQCKADVVRGGDLLTREHAADLHGERDVSLRSELIGRLVTGGYQLLPLGIQADVHTGHALRRGLTAQS